MNTLLNLLKALVIAISACLMLAGTLLGILFLTIQTHGRSYADIGFKDISPQAGSIVWSFLIIGGGVLVLLSFGCLYLPRRGRFMAASTLASIMIGIVLWWAMRLNSLMENR